MIFFFPISFALMQAPCNFSQLSSGASRESQVGACDEIKKLSEDPWWRSINGWKLRGPEDHPYFTSEIASPAAFNSKQGAESPSEDLAALINDLILAKKGEQKLSCKFPTKLRFLRQAIKKFSDSSLDFLRGKLEGLSPCLEFEKWARLDAIDHLEIILGSASTASPASLFGHMFIRVIYKLDKSSVGPGLMPFFQFAVMDEEFQSQGAFHRLWSGIAGDFEAILFERPSYLIEQDQLVRLRRSFRRFRLNLSQQKIRDVMERVWEGKSLGKAYRYYFFSQNCAALLIDFLRPGLLPEINSKKPWQLVVPPGREVKNLMNDELITPMLPDVSSRMENVRLALSAREELLNKISPNEDFSSRDPLKRLNAYRHIASPDLNTFKFFIHSITFEEYDSDIRQNFSNAMDDTFDGLLGIYAQFERANPRLAKVALDEVDSLVRENDERRALLESSRQNSAGYWNLSLGYKLLTTFDQKDSRNHLLDFRSGFLNEPLGTRSWFGSNPAGEFKAFYGELGINPAGGSILPLVDFNLLSYLNLKRPLPMIDPPLKRFLGWEARVKLERNIFVSDRFDFVPRFSLATNLYDADEYSDYVIATLGLSAPLDLSDSNDGSTIRAGLPLGMRAKKQLLFSPSLAIFLDSEFSPLFDLRTVSYRTDCSLGLEYKLVAKKNWEGFLEANIKYDAYISDESHESYSSFVGLRIAN